MDDQTVSEMDDQTKAAFASASDTSKQVITLATGLLALEITFAKDVIGKLGAIEKTVAAVSWILLLLSVIAGMWTLLALTGSLSQGNSLTPKAISASHIRIPAILQILLFHAGLLLTVLGAIAVWYG
jgi:hypothetical protein